MDYGVERKEDIKKGKTARQNNTLNKWSDGKKKNVEKNSVCLFYFLKKLECGKRYHRIIW